MKTRSFKYLQRAEKIIKLNLMDEDCINLGKTYNTRKACSCWMCGNPRHHFKGRDRLTKQELVSNLREKEQLQEIY